MKLKKLEKLKKLKPIAMCLSNMASDCKSAETGFADNSC